MRSGWPLLSLRSWETWLRLKRWHYSGGLGVPWVLNVGTHREIAGCAVTPLSNAAENEAALDNAASVGGVFCAATHYWEMDTPSRLPKQPPVGEQLRRLVERALADPRIVCCSLGTIAAQSGN
jgi:hypothetical protein